MVRVIEINGKERIISLAEVLEFKYGLVADTKQENPKFKPTAKNPHPKMVISGWRHKTKSKPSETQLKNDFSEYEVYLTSQVYKIQRVAEYPPIEEQLDAIMKGGTDFETMKSTVAAIKKKYPKPKS